MKYIVLMEFLPGVPNIWVARLNPEDPIYEFDTLEECEAKAAELQAADETGRLYKASEEQSGVTY
jgi:ribosomal protein L16/L10AE